MYGKIIGGGMLVGVYGGSYEVMSYIFFDGFVYQAGILFVNLVVMVVGYVVLKQLLEFGFYEGLEVKIK